MWSRHNVYTVKVLARRFIGKNVIVSTNYPLLLANILSNKCSLQTSEKTESLSGGSQENAETS